MARGKKSGPSRLDLRRQGEAAEARDDEAEIEDEEPAEEEEEAGDDDEAGDDEDAPKKKPKAKAKAPKKPAAPKKPSTSKRKTVKEVRQRAVWVVFDNSSKVVEKFPFSQKAAAEELLAKRQEEKKGTFYLQMVKEQMD